MIVIRFTENKTARQEIAGRICASEWTYMCNRLSFTNHKDEFADIKNITLV